MVNFNCILPDALSTTLVPISQTYLEKRSANIPDLRDRYDGDTATGSPLGILIVNFGADPGGGDEYKGCGGQTHGRVASSPTTRRVSIRGAKICMCPTLTRGVTRDGSFFLMFGSDTRALVRLMDLVWVDSA